MTKQSKSRFRAPPAPAWLKWLRAAARDPSSPARLPGPLAMLTGQDVRALSAIAACWELCTSADYDGERGALDAVRALLPALQPKCRDFARELIPFAADWSDRDRLWPRVTGDPPPASDAPTAIGSIFALQVSGHRSGCACADCVDLIDRQYEQLERELSGNCACDEGRPDECETHRAELNEAELEDEIDGLRTTVAFLREQVRRAEAKADRHYKRLSDKSDECARLKASIARLTPPPRLLPVTRQREQLIDNDPDGYPGPHDDY
jgi:hypothetical protein